MTTAQKTAVVRVAGAAKHFKSGDHIVRAVDGVDLELEPGAFAALAGPWDPQWCPL